MMHCSFRLFYLAVLSRVVSAAVGPNAELVVASKNISPDGFERPASLIGTTVDNVQFPGPVITGNKNDVFSLKVNNELSNPDLLRSTSIHWHGIYQNKTNWADGAAFVNQCPLPPNESFLYQFSATSQAGTFWYHSHQATQYCDGVRGAFIVYDPDDPYKSQYDYDDESTIITLADWYHQTYKGGLPPIPDSTLINGKGRFVGGPATDLAVVNVQQGKRYRFRIIGMSCESTFRFAIDNHKMTIIEADGQYTEPLVVDSILIYAAQRYSVIVKADQAVDNYWIRSEPLPPAVNGFDGGRNLAILHYAGAPNSEPTADPTPPINSVAPMNEVDLHALYDAAAPGLPFPGGADHVLDFTLGFNLQQIRFTMNNISFTPPTYPVLLQILSGTKKAQDLLPQNSVIPLPPDKVIEVRIRGTNSTSGGVHPFHLHGHSFSVVSSAKSPNSTSQVYNFKNPVRRDTVSTGDDTDVVIIRFRTDNHGPFFFHCHKEIHLDLGLAVVFAEDIEGTPNNVMPPAEWKNLCPEYEKWMALQDGKSSC